MATLDHINLPDDLLAAIQRRATEHGVSVQEQVVQDLAQATSPADTDDESRLLDEIRREREAMAAKGIWLTDESLKQAINEGRMRTT